MKREVEGIIGSTLWDLLDALPDADYVGPEASRRRSIVGISTDTRSVKRRELFVALRGEAFDGHRFLDQAVAKEAAAAIVEAGWYRRQRRKERGIPLIVVDDTIEAYGAIAAAHRRRFDIPVVAVAGSNGKTSTKDLIVALLSTKYSVLGTAKNLNNRIGAPATMLGLTSAHDVAVIEIGTNMPGEIEALCRAIEPTHGVITNIGREHLELLGSIEGVAKEEGALFEWLADHDGIPFVNVDDPMLRAMGKDLPNAVTFGRRRGADLRYTVRGVDESGAPIVEIDDARRRGGTMTIRTKTPGLHTAANTAAAAAVAGSLGIPARTVVAASSRFTPQVAATGGYARLAMMELPDGGRVLNDTYNANPDSVRTALETLASIKVRRGGKRIAVLGDMAELGTHTAAEHRTVGEVVTALKGIDLVFFFGRQMRRAHEVIVRRGDATRVTSFSFQSKSKLLRVLESLRTPDDVVLVKGSRSTAMDEVVTGLVRGTERRTDS